MDCQTQGHIKLTTNDFRSINKIISNHWRYHNSKDPTTSLSQALNEEIGKILSRPENHGQRVTHETLFQTPAEERIRPPLFEAVVQGCMKSLLYFLTRFGDVIDFASATEPHTFSSSPFLRRYLHQSNPSVHGSSILSAACHIRNSDRCLEVVEILVSRGALVNSCDCYNHTPLMEAAGVGNVEVLKYLIERGAIIDGCDKGGCTALFYGAASRGNSVDVSRYLVTKGADIDHHSNFGYTALHYAALEGNIETVKELLALGASPEFLQASSQKWEYVPSPPLLAASRMHRNVADLFLEHPECTPELRIDTLLLLGSALSRISVDTVEPLWREALTLREKCSLSTQSLSPVESFGSRTEMYTTADLDTVMSSRDEIQYQSWIINKRCLGTIEPNVITGACIQSIQMFKSNQYSEAEMLLKHVLKTLLSLVQCLPPDMRAYELNHSAISMLDYSLICVNTTVPEMVRITNGEAPNMTLFIDFCQEYLELMVDASQSHSCMESFNMSIMVSSTLEIFTHWYDQQVLRKANNSTDRSRMVPDEEFKTCLQQFVSACFRHSHYVALVHDALRCTGKLSADVVRTMLECGGDCYIDSLDKRGKRPLHVAVQSGEPELVSLLLEFGAHLDAVNSEGSSAAEVVGKKKNSIQRILSDLLPLPLTCLASQTIITAKIPYETIDLPLHIKNYIKLHDRHAHYSC